MLFAFTDSGLPRTEDPLRVKQRYACGKHNAIDQVLRAEDIHEQTDAGLVVVIRQQCLAFVVSESRSDYTTCTSGHKLRLRSSDLYSRLHFCNKKRQSQISCANPPLAHLRTPSSQSAQHPQLGTRLCQKVLSSRGMVRIPWRDTGNDTQMPGCLADRRSCMLPGTSLILSASMQTCCSKQHSRTYAYHYTYMDCVNCHHPSNLTIIPAFAGHSSQSLYGSR